MVEVNDKGKYTPGWTPERQAAQELRWKQAAERRAGYYTQQTPVTPVDYAQRVLVGASVLPSILTTVLITLFFGVFGVIPASMHTNRAQMAGQPTNAYWKAFGWTMAIAMVSWILFLVIVAAAINASVPTRYR